jgi:hypothetical protein
MLWEFHREGVWIGVLSAFLDNLTNAPRDGMISIWTDFEYDAG